MAGTAAIAEIEPVQELLRQGCHTASQILCDFLEFIDRTTLITRQRPDHVFKTVFEMVLDQGLLGLGNGLLDRMKLLCNLSTRPSRLHHFDDTLQVAACPLEALGDGRMGGMYMKLIIHLLMLSPREGYSKPRQLAKRVGTKRIFRILVRNR